MMVVGLIPAHVLQFRHTLQVWDAFIGSPPIQCVPQSLGVAYVRKTPQSCFFKITINC